MPARIRVSLKLMTTPNDTSLAMDRRCTGYPSSNGILVREAGAVELLHLGLDRFKEGKRSSSTAEEDGFCQRLRQIGATWWASRAEWSNTLLGDGVTAKLAKILERGWPSSEQGV